MLTSQHSKHSSHVHEEEIDLVSILATMLDYKWLILSVTFAFSLMGVIYAVLATPIYEANAMIQIEDKQSTMMGLEDMSAMMGEASQATTEINLILSRLVIGQAVDNLDLDIIAEPKRFPVIGAFIARRFTPENGITIAPSPFGFLTSFDWGGSAIDIDALTVPKFLLNKELLLTATGNGNFDIQYDDITLLKGTTGKLVTDNGISIHVNNLQANLGTTFKVIKLPRLSAIIMYQKQLIVTEVTKQSGMISLSLESPDAEVAKKIINEFASVYAQQNIERNAAEAENSLAFLHKQLPQLKAEMEKAQLELNKYQIEEKSVDISIETKSVLDQIMAIETGISDLKLKQMEMDKKFTSSHPIYQALVSQMSSMEASKSTLEAQVQNLPKKQQELIRLTRDVESSSQMYALLLNKSQELDIVRASTVGNARIIDYAEADITDPVKPNRLLILLATTFIGGVLSVMAAFIHSNLRRGVENPSEIESIDLPVYASIPFSSLQAEDEKKAAKSSDSLLTLLAHDHPTDPAIEAIRSLRTSLHFAMLEAPNNIIMFSGPSPAVGKSFISVNSAAMMAQTGKKVLLIDGDMRKGYLHKFFGSATTASGLSTLLSKQSTTEQCIQHTRVEGLDFIPRGSAPPNPSEMLLSRSFSEFLQQVSQSYDLVIIDTPPILAVADALIIGKLAGASFIVTRYGKNPLGELRATIKHFERGDVRLKGAILNGITPKALDAYRNKKYGYSNYQYAYESAKD